MLSVENTKLTASYDYSTPSLFLSPSLSLLFLSIQINISDSVRSQLTENVSVELDSDFFIGWAQIDRSRSGSIENRLQQQ